MTRETTRSWRNVDCTSSELKQYVIGSCFLSHKNKPQLNLLFSITWRSDEFAAKVSKKRNIIVIENGNDFKITDIPEIKSTIEETDARIGLYAIYVKDDGFKYVEIRTFSWSWHLFCSLELLEDISWWFWNPLWYR